MSSDARAVLPTILVVDDTVENLAVLTDLLSPAYCVRAVRSGRRALQALAEPRPDLILLDVMMPEMDGYEVMSRLRDDPGTADIPVIFVTALDAAMDEERGLALGAVDYITKPIKPAIVLARIKTQLELKAARDRLRNENLLLEAEVSRRMQENLLIQDASIRALAHLAEIRDPETGNHLRRTQGYVGLLADALRTHPRFAPFLTERTIDLLVKSAPLHDIGKVGVPDYILLKPGKLTPEEWEIMKTHSRLGREAIELAERDAECPLAFLAIAKDIAHYHHEKWDGSGYPEGLEGRRDSDRRPVDGAGGCLRRTHVPACLQTSLLVCRDRDHHRARARHPFRSGCGRRLSCCGARRSNSIAVRFSDRDSDHLDTVERSRESPAPVPSGHACPKPHALRKESFDVGCHRADARRYHVAGAAERCAGQSARGCRPDHGPGKLSCILVLEEGQPVGILTERDLLRLLGREVDLERPVAEVMTTPVLAIPGRRIFLRLPPSPRSPCSPPGGGRPERQGGRDRERDRLPSLSDHASAQAARRPVRRDGSRSAAPAARCVRCAGAEAHAAVPDLVRADRGGTSPAGHPHRARHSRVSWRAMAHRPEP
jgi:putative two-component system response regulator